MHWFFRYRWPLSMLVMGVEYCSVLELLGWWSRQQLTCLTESSNVCFCPLRKDGVHAVHFFPSLHPCLHPSLPPRCRFYELPWALIHLCHTQAPLLPLLTNWFGLQMERACRTCLVSAVRTKTCKSGRKKKKSGHLGVDEPRLLHPCENTSESGMRMSLIYCSV